jgi:hypothetical protein
VGFPAIVIRVKFETFRSKAFQQHRAHGRYAVSEIIFAWNVSVLAIIRAIFLHPISMRVKLLFFFSDKYFH